ncbi:ABC transporter substrate-binding protein [Oceanibacterium hippocampi]|uniref:Leucine-, isoleucine-, valine-, threonine-, and alanine-binding protein n=1 Tax=Oceanibacterium hippocampi TaxID=745714 RepID=A0A1Y5R7A4_9PROT|nr:ABC transporter substrate-binding protein [Oceanibacterium hippocampi]SLN10511.1 Leucine-, isoleucine-, valine-, threonine-, and alanine-binding protein precursor [Oceanibacterium hippocampi]
MTDFRTDNNGKTRGSRALPVSRRGFTLGAAATAAVLGAPGILKGARAATPLKIGCLAPLTGFFAREGQNCKRGFDIAPALLSDMGHTVEIMMADTESNPDKARTAAEKLVNEGAQVLIGTFVSGETAAVAQVAEQRGIPHIINVAAAPQITEQGYKYVFRNFTTGPMLVINGLGLIKQLMQKVGATPKGAVFMHVNDTFGTAMSKGIEALYGRMEMPFPILETIAYDPKAKDLSVEVAKAKASGADIVFPVSHGADAILLIREMVKQRFEPAGIMTPGSPGTYEAQFYKALDKYSEFVMANVPWIDPSTDMSKAFTAAFDKTFKGELMELNAGFSFEAVLIAADAHARAGSADPGALADAIRATDIAEHVMIGGPIQFDEKGQNVNIKSATLQNLDRMPTVVMPAESAQHEPVYPMPGWRDAARK